MTLTEIKKEIYRSGVAARFSHAKKGFLYYKSIWLHNEGSTEIIFSVPTSDMGDATFEDLMPAKLLIRYIVQPEISTNE